jgi:phosphatidylglycerophosphate synthase
MERIRQAVIVTTAAPDPGIRVGGLPLLKRTILTLGRAGLTEVLIVAGPAALAFRAEIAGDTAYGRAGITATMVDSIGPSSGEDCVVVGLAHVFDDAAVRAVVDAPGDEGRRPVHAGRSGPDRVVYVGGEILLDALRCHGSLAAAIAALDAADQISDVQLGTSLVARVDTPADRANAQDLLLRSLAKPTDGFVARHLNRRISRLATRALLACPVTPNQMTMVAGAIGFAGVWLVANATWTGMVAGAALIEAQSILDGCDGEIARITFQRTRLGEWLDNVIDDAINIAYAVALGHATAVLLDAPLYRAIGLLTACGFVIYAAVLYADLALVHGSGNPFLFRWWFQKRDAYLQQSLSGGGPRSHLAGLVHAMGRRDLFLLAFLVLCAAKQPHVAVLWYAAVALVSALLASVHVLASAARALGIARSPR